MGQQQIILIVLTVIIVGTAIAVGLLVFQSSAISASKDALIEDLTKLAANAQAYYLRPRSSGGGGNSFTGYFIPKKMLSNEDGSFELVGGPINAVNTTVRFKATSVDNPDNWITAELDKSRPQLRLLQFNNDFEDSE